MREWVDSTVGAVTLYQRAGGTPTATTDSFYGGDIPFVTIEDITNGTRFLDRTEKCLSEAGLANSAACLIKEPHILYSMYATVGKPIINRIACATNQAIIALKESSEIEQSFLFYQLLFIRPNVYKYTAQTTQSNLNAGSVRKLPISYPKDKREQRKIATILSGIDTVIEKTEALITKYQQINAGLMHDLFTRGVLSNGQLRPPHEQAPHLYQETAIGWIPKEWEITGLANKGRPGTHWIRTGPFGSALKGEHWRTHGHPVITIGALGESVFTYDELLFVNSRDAARLIDFQLKAGDVVFSRVADVGRSVVVRSEQAGWIMSSNLMRIAVDENRARPDFLQMALASDSRIKSQIRARVNSGGRDVANSDVLSQLRFVWPDIDEQDRIIARANRASHRINGEQMNLSNLLAQKQGLMHDLLTSKKPVTIENKTTTTEAVA